MYSLKELQTSFQRHLLHGDNDIIEHIVSSQHASDKERLATYKNAYYGRLAEALATDFPAVKMSIGSDQFSKLCSDYIDKHPSTDTSLRWFGIHFSEFIQQHTVIEDYKFLTELATLEWMFINAFDASNADPVPASLVTTIPNESWPNITIDLHPSVYTLNSHWNVVEIWQAMQQHQTAPQAMYLAEASTCVIWRQGLSTRYRILDKFEAIALHSAAQGATYAQICERLAQSIDEQVPDFTELAMLCARLLKTWLTEGMIARLSTDTQ